MAVIRVCLVAAAVSALFVMPGCTPIVTNTFADGTYAGSVGQVLVIAGDEFSYYHILYTFAGSYVIEGSSVTFNTTAVNGQPTGLNQRTTFDFTSTSRSISLSDMRNMENGGCGIAPDTYTK